MVGDAPTASPGKSLAHDRRPVDPEALGRLALAQLAVHQLQPQLVLLARAQEPLGAAPQTIASGVLLGPLHPPGRGRRTLPDAAQSQPECRTRSQTQDTTGPLWKDFHYLARCQVADAYGNVYPPATSTALPIRVEVPLEKRLAFDGARELGERALVLAEACGD